MLCHKADLPGEAVERVCLVFFQKPNLLKTIQEALLKGNIKAPDRDATKSLMCKEFYKNFVFGLKHNPEGVRYPDGVK